MSGPVGAATAGTATSALPAIANVRIAAARPRAVPAPDPWVAAAFALGWQMAELYRPGRRVRVSPAACDDLPGQSGLDERHILQLGVDQLGAGQAALDDTIAGAGLDVPDLGPLQSSVTSGAQTSQ